MVEKKSSELRGSERCKTLRKFEGLKNVLETTKTPAYDIAILFKDIMRGFLQKDFETRDFKELVMEGLDENSFYTERSMKAYASKTLQLLIREARSIDDMGLRESASFPERKIIEKGNYRISVCPDVVFTDGDTLNAVIFRAGKPDVTQGGKKVDGSAANSLELYFLLLYARTLVPAGKQMKVKASYWFAKRNDDTSTKLGNIDFFAEKGGNIVELVEEEYVGGTDDTKIDEQFAPQLDLFEEGSEVCSPEACKACKMNSQCNYQKSPKPYEKKTLGSKKGKITPSDAQQLIIDFREGYCKVNAGAGTGKTECMTERGARMFEEGTDPSHMLFITFTEAGATEMKERISKKCQARGLDVSPEQIKAMTFNAFAFEIVKAHAADLGFRRKPDVVDYVRNSVIITELLKEDPIPGLDELNFTMDSWGAKGALTVMAKTFEAIKTDRVDVDAPDATSEFMDCLTRHGLRPYIAAGAYAQVIDLYRKYEKRLKEECLVQFADQEPMMDKVIEMFPDTLEDLHLEHIVVDEFQDSNDVQLDTIKKLCACKDFRSLMVVGDDSQAIYGFRNTSPENIIHFFEKMNVKGEELYLTENRRSTDEIIALANKINDLNKEKVAKTMIATRGSGAPVHVKGFHSKQEEYGYIAGKVLALADKGVPYEDMAFIAYKKSELIAMAAELSKYEIPWVMKNPLPLLENSRIKAAVSLAMSFFEPDATKSYFDYLVALHDGDIFDEENAEEIIDEVEKLKSEMAGLENLPFEAQRAVFHKKLEDIKGNDELYAHFLDQVYRNEDFTSELAYIRNFARFGEKEEKKMEQSYEGVVLVTAHSSKGLEWPYVFNSVTGYDGELMHTGSNSAIEERRRLLFVSMTRARDELFITGQYIAYGNKECYVYNRFLEEVFDALGEKYDPVDHEKEKLEAEKKERKKKELAEKRAKAKAAADAVDAAT